MHRDILTEAELQALLGEDQDNTPIRNSAWDGDERKLLHALVRNQLRLLHTIEEMQSELRLLKAAAGASRSVREAATGLEPLPLPFMKHSAAGQAGADSYELYNEGPQKAPAAEVSRKERYKRKSLW